jgi:hypothetical protein
VLDAAGKRRRLIETVGVGQDEVDIVRTADVSIVTLVPGAGDEVQALKAGIMEIADIFVVNKADREGADRTAASIEAMLSLHAFADGEWRPPRARRVADARAARATGSCSTSSGTCSKPESSNGRWNKLLPRAGPVHGRGPDPGEGRRVASVGEPCRAVN